MKKKYVFIILISMFFMLISVMGVVSAANWTVNPGDSIQSAVDNASDNDTVIVNDDNGSDYTYIESVVVNKKLTIKPCSGHNVTLNAVNSSEPEFPDDPESPLIITYEPVFTVTSAGSGSVIQGFIIMGAVNLENANNCLISGIA